MKSLVWLTEQVLQDCGTRCGVDVSRDIVTVRRRVENEGDSFLTITLPSFCKGFEEALASGRLEPSSFPACRCKKGLPVFLRGFLSKIFHTNRQLREDACIDCISSIRQICLLHKKVLLSCTKKRERRAEQAFIACEHELGELKFDQNLFESFGKVADIVITDILQGTPEGNPYEELRPRHGPGSTQERILGNAKFAHRKWHTRLEDSFPFTEYGIASLRNLGEEDCPLSNVEFVEPGAESPVRVVFVPKTLKTPRVIAIEPVCMQYTQQSLLQWLVPLIERNRLTGNRVNFTDQSINQNLARIASKTGSLATLDLSEASDRVHSDLVWRMLQSAPVLRDMVFACRSTRATLPSKVTLTLNKFASMGSALCFPMEALAFYCAAVASRIQRAQLSVNLRTVQKYGSQVYVYGDDIILPVDAAPSVCDDFKLIGFKVNQNKSFWTGKFRESCGVDAYDGVDITPVYCRRMCPANRRSHKEFLSWVSMANLFYQKGYWRVAQAVRDVIDSMMKFPLPFLDERSPGVGWVSYSNANTVHRWNNKLHRFETKAYTVVPTKSPDPLNGDGALMKFFLAAGESLQSLMDVLFPKAQDVKNLFETARRGALTLKLQWVPA